MSRQVLSFTLFFTLISNKFSQHWRAARNPSAGRMRPAGRGLDSTVLHLWNLLTLRNENTLRLNVNKPRELLIHRRSWVCSHLISLVLQGFPLCPPLWWSLAITLTPMIN